jgi:plasmid stability protein
MAIIVLISCKQTRPYRTCRDCGSSDDGLQKTIAKPNRFYLKGVISLLSNLAETEVPIMATLIVRNLDPAIVDALKLRAARHGRSAEAEHRALLESALLSPGRRSLAEALMAMPNVGRDDDFSRAKE